MKFCKIKSVSCKEMNQHQNKKFINVYIREKKSE